MPHRNFSCHFMDWSMCNFPVHCTLFVKTINFEIIFIKFWNLVQLTFEGICRSKVQVLFVKIGYSIKQQLCYYNYVYLNLNCSNLAQLQATAYIFRPVYFSACRLQFNFTFFCRYSNFSYQNITYYLLNASLSLLRLVKI